eukprot:TRINITY_DN3343_c0_g1_i1.p1 TRINITY_DN3343_c0_g1~~TRINITY_DN3343_c0_g1_i1.p1  ORF type:complete len:253 (+),score=27.30 TRINITY_DN3343_c0_g1_i1:58-816(+)
MTDPIRVCCISDTHTFHEKLQLKEGDILIHTGDFTLRGSREEITEFAEWLQKQPYKHKVVIPGNHELSLDVDRFNLRLEKFKSKPSMLSNIKNNCDPALFVKILTSVPGCTYLDHEGTDIMGIKFFGTPYIPVISDWAFMLKNSERREKFKEIPADTQILLSHTPPFKILDSSSALPDAQRFGCAELLAEVLDRIRPTYHIFGHCHSGYGTRNVNGITFINASICDEDYAAVNEPVYFTISQPLVSLNTIDK